MQQSLQEQEQETQAVYDTCLLFCQSFLEGLLQGNVPDFSVPKEEDHPILDDPSLPLRPLSSSSSSSSSMMKSQGGVLVRKFISPTGRRKYVQFFTVLACVVELQSCQRTMLQRDIYYALKHFFRNQKECDDTIFDVGRVLSLRRHEMHILSSSKALLFGGLQFRFLLSDSTSSLSSAQYSPWTDCNYISTCTGVIVDNLWLRSEPNAIDLVLTDANISYLIVIEKEAIFHRLIEDGFPRQAPCILLTSCGFPDIATRAAVCHISNFFPTIRVLALVDCNPHGYAIMRCFRQSPVRTSWEGKGLQSDLHWLGLRPTQLKALLSSPQHLNAFEAIQQNLQHLSQRDQALLDGLIKSLIGEGSGKGLDVEGRRSKECEELRLMQAEGFKCELEALYALGISNLTDYLVQQLLQGQFI